MSRYGNFNMRELERFKDKLEQMKVEEFMTAQAKLIAQRLITLTKQKTPVDTGHLRRNWAMGTVEKAGNTYIVTVSNNVEYASFVEEGHRNKTHTGWIPGKHMLTISEYELQDMAPRILQRNIKAFLREVFRE